MSIRRRFIFAAGSLLVAATVSCAAETRSGGGQGGADTSALCFDLQEMSRVVLRAKTLSAFSQHSDAKKLRSELQAVFSKVEASAAAEGLDVAALEDEVDAFDAFALRVPVSITMGQFANVLSGQAAVVAKQQTRVADAAGCTA